MIITIDHRPRWSVVNITNHFRFYIKTCTLYIMKTNKFYIKNMVCEHCGQVLRGALEQAGYEVKDLDLGELELAHSIDEEDYQQLVDIARKNGFEIISDESSRLVEQIKHLIISQVHAIQPLEENLSNYLTDELHKEYQTLSRLFSSVEGKSIERYFILQKIERAKELIVYGEQTFSEIAHELGYSSSQHFSRQFKKETGLSPSHFRDIKENKRISIDRL